MPDDIFLRSFCRQESGCPGLLPRKKSRGVRSRILGLRVPRLHGGFDDMLARQNMRTLKCHKEPAPRSTWSGVLSPGVNQECPDREERGTRGVRWSCAQLYQTSFSDKKMRIKRKFINLQYKY